MTKKTVVSVQLLCTKCKKKVMKLVADLDGVTSIVLDPSKSTATVIGETDPALIIKRIRKFRKCAELVSVGPPKDEKKDVNPIMPNCCQGCDSWFIIREDSYWHCSIL
ncbi:unnamed protein product [Victoria cruziana]